MNEGNRHFQHNWLWADNVAGVIRQRTPAAQKDHAWCNATSFRSN
jgi:hypothetical protein